MPRLWHNWLKAQFSFPALGQTEFGFGDAKCELPVRHPHAGAEEPVEI